MASVRTKKKIIRLLQKLAGYSHHEKWFLLYLIVATISIFLFPLVTINVGSLGTSKMIFLFTGALWKTALLILITRGVLIAWNFSKKAKSYLMILVGFRENPYLLNFALLWMVTIMYLSVGDATQLVRTETTSIELTMRFFRVQVLLLGGMIYTVIRFLRDAKMLQKTNAVHVVNDSKDVVFDEETLDGLFSDEKESLGVKRLSGIGKKKLEKSETTEETTPVDPAEEETDEEELKEKTSPRTEKTTQKKSSMSDFLSQSFGKKSPAPKPKKDEKLRDLIDEAQRNGGMADEE